MIQPSVVSCCSKKRERPSVPIAYTSRRLCPEEKNYTAMERDMLAVVHALRVWKLYLFAQSGAVRFDCCRKSGFGPSPCSRRVFRVVI